MVLSNKKLKHKLRSDLAGTLASSEAKPLTNTGDSESLKQLIVLASQKPRSSKRQKRRLAPSSSGPQVPDSNGNIENCGEIIKEDGKKRLNSDEEESDQKKELKKRKKKRKRGVDEDETIERPVSESEMKENVAMEEKGRSKKRTKKMKKKKKKKGKENREGDARGHEMRSGEQGSWAADTGNCPDQEKGDLARKVYVGGIPYYSTEDDIRSYFEGCGTITEIDCMKFPESGKFRGIAMISFKTEAAAKRALELDGSDMGGLYLKIQPYKENKTKKTSDFAPEIVEGYNRIYAGNLSWDITEDDLRKLFSNCNISSIRFGTDKETGEFRGYAHVDFADNLSLNMALKLDQSTVCERPVKIRCAVPKKGAVGEDDRKKETKEKKRRTCYGCGEPGHISSKCPKNKTPRLN